MKTILLNAYEFNLKYAEQLLIDVEEEMMCICPSDGLENHAAFTIGHLVSAAALTSKYLGGPYDINPQWESLFKRKGPGDPRKPDVDSGQYPDKNTLLKALTQQHRLVEQLIEDLDEKRINEHVKWRFSDHLQSLGELLYFMCITHESMHLGQLAAWRRALGLPSALSKL